MFNTFSGFYKQTYVKTELLGRQESGKQDCNLEFSTVGAAEVLPNLRWVTPEVASSMNS